MRWFWIDRFERFVSGVEAVAIKNVTFAEETAGRLPSRQAPLPAQPHHRRHGANWRFAAVSQLSNFEARIVLAKVSRAEFFRIVQPGDQLRLTARLESVQPDGAIVQGQTHVGDELQGQLELTFAILDESYGDASFFEPVGLMRMLRVVATIRRGGRPARQPYRRTSRYAQGRSR